MWRDEDPDFEQLIREFLPEFPPAAELTPDLNLSAHGLDSVAMVGLIAALEDHWSVTFPEEAFVVEQFATPRAVWEARAKWVLR